MKSRFPVAALAALFALATFAGCRSNEPKEQGGTPNGQPSATSPSKEKPAVEKPPKPVELPSLTVTPKQPNDPSAVIVKVAFAKMELGTSPTFGLIYRNWVMALYERNYEKAWGLLSPNARGKVEANLKGTIDQQGMAIQAGNLMLSRTDPGTQAKIRSDIKRREAQIAELSQFDAQRYFVWVLQQNEARTGENPAYSYFTDPPKFIGEKIEGDTGFAKIDAPPPKDKLPFARENGGWEIDFAPFTAEQVNRALEPEK
jgi:hypothetical protein